MGTSGLDDAIAPQWKTAYESIPVLATSTPTKEVFVAATPDFALASYRSAFADDKVGTREQLATDGIGTYLDPFSCPETSDRPAAEFSSVWDSLRDVGVIFDAQQKAEEVIKDQESALNAIKEAKTGEGLKILWWDSETESPYVGAGAGGPAMIMEAVSGTNLFADQEGSWQNVSWETIVAGDPDVIVLADASWSTAQEKIDFISADPVLKELTAVKEKAFITIPFSQTTAGVTLIDGATALSDALAARK